MADAHLLAVRARVFAGKHLGDGGGTLRGVAAQADHRLDDGVNPQGLLGALAGRGVVGELRHDQRDRRGFRHGALRLLRNPFGVQLRRQRGGEDFVTLAGFAAYAFHRADGQLLTAPRLALRCICKCLTCHPLTDACQIGEGQRIQIRGRS